MSQEINTSPNAELREFIVSIPTRDGKGIAERIPMLVPMEFDAELGEWLITPEGHELIEDTKARHMGLILPQELRELREKLQLTQEAIGCLLKIGEKSWTRWETGKQRPSQSMNLLLRALQTGLISAADIKRLNEPQTDWTPVFGFKASAPETLRIELAAPAGATVFEQAASAEYEEQPFAA